MAFPSKKLHFIFLGIFLMVTSMAAHVSAADKTVRFVSVSWTGVTIKTELGVHILNSLGYQTSNLMVSVPFVYNSLATNEADVFLGNWMPSMRSIAEPYFAQGSIVQYVANMTGAKYTLAAPTYVVEGGLRNFADIVDYGEQLSYRIYGIEEGNDGNEIIQDMIDNNMFGLGDFQLISSSEQGMLSEVRYAIRENKWIVFLGWSPHYMNEILDMQYLDGSTAETFGDNNGTATVYTNLRQGFAEENPNVALFLKNFIFPVDMLNQIMTEMHETNNPRIGDMALSWVKNHPEVYRQWLEGVQTIDGAPALPAFEAYLNK
ncbi:ABC transporter substrate-binding protein [Desulfobulbus alkaliphilus]|uniref:ABC transporter substrate-binding protein n=1 Tax=Desulfobulbus alkaliphilus TaxID=869814 RepID=UPI001963D8D2|nr:ABC transporter substrate-binding protein [Desulfobulbus alkaliphilus]MBM9537465.1 ABC transporter substrate-binding protein [Desulfobulbus alkaliphilus]